MMLSESLRCVTGIAADVVRLAPHPDLEFSQTSGAVFRSRTPWKGRGQRPTVAFAPSTQGVAPQCDPSYSCTVGVAFRKRPFDVIAAYEQPAINLLVAAGANVVLTDYPRDPEDNVQLYCDHVSAARALADAVRAAEQLGVRSAVVGLWGFSQGGGAVGGWLENPEYAPEIQSAAAVVGAPPADLLATLHHADRAIASVVILYAVAGMMAASPAVAAELAPVLSPQGLEIVLFDSGVCYWCHYTSSMVRHLDLDDVGKAAGSAY